MTYLFCSEWFSQLFEPPCTSGIFNCHSWLPECNSQRCGKLMEVEGKWSTSSWYSTSMLGYRRVLQPAKNNDDGDDWLIKLINDGWWCLAPKIQDHPLANGTPHCCLAYMYYWYIYIYTYHIGIPSIYIPSIKSYHCNTKMVPYVYHHLPLYITFSL